MPRPTDKPTDEPRSQQPILPNFPVYVVVGYHTLDSEPTPLSTHAGPDARRDAIEVAYRCLLSRVTRGPLYYAGGDTYTTTHLDHETLVADFSAPHWALVRVIPFVEKPPL